MTEFANLITAIAALMAACGSLASILISLRNGRKIKEVHDATNGMKTELVDAVRAGSLATGKAEGLAEGRAENHAP